MARDLAGIIQGEAGSDPAAQFAVAATIYNRAQSGSFPGGSDPVAVANAPQQFIGYNSNSNSSAQQFAQAIQDGTLPQYGNTGNAVNFGSNQPGNQFASNHGLTQGADIGGNFFSDNLGPPSSNFVAPQFGGSTDVAPDQFNPNASADQFGADLQIGNLPSGLSAGNVALDNSSAPIFDASGNPIGTDTSIDPSTPSSPLTATSGSGGGLTYSATPEQSVAAPPAKSSFDIPDVGAAITKGFNAVTAQIGAQTGKIIGDTLVGLQRYAVMAFALVIFLAAAWMMVPRETKQGIVSTAAKAAA